MGDEAAPSEASSAGGEGAPPFEPELETTPYELLREIGAGAYGTVWAARSRADGRRVAVKRLSGILDDTRAARRALRELRILSHFTHDNLLSASDMFLAPTADAESFREVFVVTELMGSDLARVIGSRKLSGEHQKYFSYQLLRGLKCIHSAAVFHRDLKPGNILVNSNCDLKICDFGMSRGGGGGDSELNLTQMEYCGTRWYRAPEGLLGADEYGTSVDMWSAGCIIAEMIGGKPLFPGRDTMHQIELIVRGMGTPGDEEIELIKREKFRRFIRGLCVPRQVPFVESFPQFAGADAQAVDLIQQLLQFNPERRLTAADALRHPFLEELHDEDDEPTAAALFEEPTLKARSASEFRPLIYDEIVRYRKKSAAASTADTATAATTTTA